MDYLESLPESRGQAPTARTQGHASEELIGELSRTLRERVRDPRPAVGDRGRAATDAGLQMALDRLCAEARADGLSAEQVLVAFKHMLDSIPELSAGVPVDAARALRGHLVTACIEAYFARAAPEPRAGAVAAAGPDHPGGSPR